MGITLTDNSFELIFQHLSFNDILNLCQVSKSLNEIISNSPKCLRKVTLNLIKDDNNQVVEFLHCFRQNKRKYQNVKVDCHNSHYITEKYMLVLKTIERSIVNLEVQNASFRWDEINTRNFHDQWLILTDLKKLKVCSINDYTAEIFFISCTYLEQLHVENVRLSKYFNYCLRVNEKLKDLKILHPQGISYDYEFYGFTAYNFKLDYLDFNCKENQHEKSKHEFLKRVIYPILTTQVKNLKRCRIKGVYFDAVNIVLETLNHDDFECKKLNYAVTSAHVKFVINNLQFFCIEMHEIHAEFCNNLMVFIERQNTSLKEICISSNIIDDGIACILFKNHLNVDHLSIGGSLDLVNGRNEKITKIITSATCLEELKNILKLSPCLKVLQIFELSKELLGFVTKELKDLEVIKFHFKDVDNYNSDIKLQQLTCYDPFLRICNDLHELLFQHFEDDSFSEELTRTWTRFYFK